MMNEEVKYRKEFLLKMYEQLCTENNRNINFLVQSVSVLIGIFAILSLTEKGLISLDIATIVIILICTWFIRLIIDSNYWYNRNLAIISNIEKEFLLNSDLKDVQHYFSGKRDKNSFLSNYKTHLLLGIGISVIMILTHFVIRIFPGFFQDFSNFQWTPVFPYLILSWCIFSIVKFQKKQSMKYSEFIDFSPGKISDYEGKIFESEKYSNSVGHPTNAQKWYERFFLL